MMLLRDKMQNSLKERATSWVAENTNTNRYCYQDIIFTGCYCQRQCGM
jgi:hypothetical protein